MLLANRSYKAVIAGDSKSLFKEDIIYPNNEPSGDFKGEIMPPKADSYWLILNNDSLSNSKRTLECFINNPNK